MDPEEKNPHNTQARSYTFEALDEQFRDRPEEIDSPSLKETPPEAIARFMEEMNVDQCRAILRKLTWEQAAEACLNWIQNSLQVLLAMREFRANEILNEIAQTMR